MGRPSKKTPELLAQIVEEFGKGRPQFLIADDVGVTSETIRVWRRDDEDFDVRCRNAIAQWTKGKLDIIEAGALDSKTGPQWAKECLRMRFPLEFGDLGTHVATKRLEKEEIDSTLKELSTEDILRELKRRGEERGQ
jgi:hypothetical protein